MPPVHPKIASSCATVAPAFAARVAAILRTPCADPGTCAERQASRNRLPNDSFVSGWPLSPAMNVRSPQGPAASVSENWKDRQRYGDGEAALFRFDLPDAIAHKSSACQ